MGFCVSFYRYSSADLDTEIEKIDLWKSYKRKVRTEIGYFQHYSYNTGIRTNLNSSVIKYYVFIQE